MTGQSKPMDQRDVKKNWVLSSRFIFHVSIFCLLAFVVGCSFRMYQQRFKPYKPKVNESSLYTPTYKAN